MSKLKIIAISDVHNRFKDLIIPQCDILISCGDYSSMGYLDEVRKFHKWLDKQNARYIISVQGNHELGVEKDFKLAKSVALKECPEVYFIDEGLVEIDGIKIWCSAITPFFCDWAWNRHSNEIKTHWDRIPEDINILISHGPPYGILDTVNYADGTQKSNHLGCPFLMTRVNELKNLDLHMFGHIHSSHGEKHINGKSFYNASICDELYQPSNPITIIEYEKE